VQIGRSNGTESEILDGLHEGEALIVYPGDKVADGTRVAPMQIGGR
jgi:HlyD family secretion protein